MQQNLRQNLNFDFHGYIEPLNKANYFSLTNFIILFVILQGSFRFVRKLSTFIKFLVFFETDSKNNKALQEASRFQS